MKKTWTDAALADAVRRNETTAGVLRQIGLQPIGGNYSTINAAIQKLGLDDSHFKGHAWRKGKRFELAPKRPLKEMLRKGRKCNSTHLRKRLIHEGLLEEKCSSCKRTGWLGIPIPLELDHINGDSEDNRIENLRLLCPNCHALTPNYRGRAIKKARRIKNPKCPQCSAPVWREGSHCRGCAQKRRTKGRHRKVGRPPKSVIQKEIAEVGFEATGRKYGVSGNAIRKWIR